MVIAITLTCVPNVSAKARPKLNKKKVTITVGTTVKLKMKNTKKKVKWSSSKKSVATVSKKGKVKAKKAGKATITAKIGKKRWQCKITVKKKIIKKTIKQRIAAVVKAHGKAEYDSDEGTYYSITKYNSYEDGDGLTMIEYHPKGDKIEIYNMQEISGYYVMAGATLKNLNDRYCEVSFLEKSVLGYGSGIMDKYNASSSTAVKFDFYTMDEDLVDTMEEATGLMIQLAMNDFDSVMKQYGERITHKDLGFVF